ncbi:unnamed protein product [Lactuca saligna]|uniref:Uncharacterized protein n=1 Tax=Lactuca saligna TaxID=75948 RepID=A0AA35ZR43_LACSI|nr:unnamed protein product [Lactuca saligna]
MKEKKGNKEQFYKFLFWKHHTFIKRQKAKHWYRGTSGALFFLQPLLLRHHRHGHHHPFHFCSSIILELISYRIYKLRRVYRCLRALGILDSDFPGIIFVDLGLYCKRVYSKITQ